MSSANSAVSGARAARVDAEEGERAVRELRDEGAVAQRCVALVRYGAGDGERVRAGAFEQGVDERGELGPGRVFHEARAHAEAVVPERLSGWGGARRRETALGKPVPRRRVCEMGGRGETTHLDEDALVPVLQLHAGRVVLKIRVRAFGGDEREARGGRGHAAQQQEQQHQYRCRCRCRCRCRRQCSGREIQQHSLNACRAHAHIP